MHVINPQSALPSEQQSADLTGSADADPSPDGRWLAFNQSIHTLKDNGSPGPDQNAHLLYDPERDTFRVLTLPLHASGHFWTDKSHLQIWQDGERKQFDVVTGTISPIPVQPPPASYAASKQYPDLTLDTEYRVQEDKQPTGGHLESNLIWIRRTPFGRMPLGAPPPPG